MAIFSFLLGLAVGSFANSMIWRLRAGENPLKGRSHCVSCAHELSWRELVPLLSFVWLGGRCSSCRTPISWQYPAVELASGLLFLALWLTVEPPAVFLWWVLASSFLVVFVYDLRHMLIPDAALLAALPAALGLGLLEGELVRGLWAGAAAAGLFLAVVLASRGRAMGVGDVKLAFVIGVALGPSLVASALFVSFLLGGLVGLVLVAFKKKGMRSEVPFGPFLVLGAFFALWRGERLVSWYLSQLL